jgi:hypothetical protein
MTGKSGRLGLVAALGLLATTAVPAYADPAITCAHQFDEWSGGFTAARRG